MSQPINDGGSAFPSEQGLLPNGTSNQTYNSGMSLRDWFAGMALQGTAANPSFRKEKWETHAKASYEAADAMLAARTEGVQDD